MKTREQLLSRLSSLKKGYEDKIKQLNEKDVVLEKLKYDAPSDDELVELARASIDEKYKRQSQDKMAEVQNKRLSFLDALEKAQQLADNQKSVIRSEYEGAKSQVESDALKRGLQRSSVVSNQIGELAKAEKSDLIDLERDLAETIGTINGKISSLEDELDKSLKDMDIQRAVETNERIKALKDERDKKQAEVVKYNNSVMLDEAKHFADSSQQRQKEIDEATIQSNRAMVSEVLDYYLAMGDSEKALEELSKDDEIKDFLGKYYNYVYNALKIA